MGKGETLIDGDSVSNTIYARHKLVDRMISNSLGRKRSVTKLTTRVNHNTGGTTGSVQRKHGLDGNVKGGDGEGFEHNLSHALTIGLGVKRGLSEKDGVLGGVDSKLGVEGMVPDLLHIIPVGTILSEKQNAS